MFLRRIVWPAWLRTIILTGCKGASFVGSLSFVRYAGERPAPLGPEVGRGISISPFPPLDSLFPLKRPGAAAPGPQRCERLVRTEAVLWAPGKTGARPLAPINGLLRCCFAALDKQQANAVLSVARATGGMVHRLAIALACGSVAFACFGLSRVKLRRLLLTGLMARAPKGMFFRVPVISAPPRLHCRGNLLSLDKLHYLACLEVRPTLHLPLEGKVARLCRDG